VSSPDRGSVVVDPGKFPIPGVVFGGAMALARRLLRGEVKVDEVNRKRIQKARAWLERASEVTEGFSVDDPGTWAQTAGRVMDEAFETHGVPEESAEWRRMHGFTRPIERAGAILTRVRASKYVERDVVYEEDDEVLEVLSTRGGGIFVLSMVREEQLHPKGLFVHRTADMDVIRGEMAKAFWAGAEAVRMESKDSGIEISRMSFESFEFIGEERELIEQWEAFMRAGHSRNVLLQGEPGTGKTTLCGHAARELSDRALLLTGRLLDALEPTEWRAMFRLMAPEVVIIDDVDRAGGGSFKGSSGRYLELLRDLRGSVPLVLMTSNDHTELPPALRRPGRIDRIVEFEQSPREVRQRAVGQLAEEVGVEIPEGRGEWLVDLLTEHGGAHVREVLERASVLGWEALTDIEGAFHLHSDFTDAFDWLKAKNYRSVDINCRELIHGLFANGESGVCFRGEVRKLEQLELPNGFRLCREAKDADDFRNQALWGKHPEPRQAGVRELLAEGVQEQFWDDRSQVVVSSVERELMFTETSFDGESFVGERSGYVERWESFMEAGRRRCVLLQGPPGVGKTTLCRQAARELGDRALFVEAKAFRDVRTGEWLELMELLDPVVVTVDDVDRISRSELNSKLSLLEEGLCSVPLMLLTCNDPEQLPDAMKRPGRIDQTISFDAPGEARRKKLVVALAEREGVDIPEGWLDVLDEVFRRQSPAHVREVLRRADVVGWEKIGELPGEVTFEGGGRSGSEVRDRRSEI